MQVRDYECDLQGIVNNANYLHYAEHTRHLFLKQQGVSFAAMHEGVKYIFYQDIYRMSDNKLSFRGQIEVVCLVDGRLAESPTCDKAFAEYLSE